ncbi:hypothetical protein OF83DRAFT_464100 [Amylostereum chailletii]|nr:hypothetical protein OF83DRAFT_464100 [Amylostereum chailletii]
MEVSPSIWAIRDSPSSSHGVRRHSHKNNKKHRGGPGYDLGREQRLASKKRRDEPVVPNPIPRCIYVPRPGRPKPLTIRIPSLLEVKIMNVSLGEKRVADPESDDDGDNEDEEQQEEDAAPTSRRGPYAYPSSPTSMVSDLERTPEPKPRAFEPPRLPSVDTPEASTSSFRRRLASVAAHTASVAARNRTTRSILDESRGGDDADDERSHCGVSRRHQRRSTGSRARASAAPYTRRPVRPSLRTGLAEVEAHLAVSVAPVPSEASWPALVNVQPQSAPSTGYITFDHMRGPDEDEEL